jgi:hypothetical protein
MGLTYGHQKNISSVHFISWLQTLTRSAEVCRKNSEWAELGTWIKAGGRRYIAGYSVGSEAILSCLPIIGHQGEQST